MKRYAACLALLIASPFARGDCEIPQEFWDWPRSGAAALDLKPIRPCMEAYLADPGSALVLHSGQDGDSTLHADELRAWLVSLAVNPARISMKADLPAPGITLATEKKP